jgi:hypothetical protein
MQLGAACLSNQGARNNLFLVTHLTDLLPNTLTSISSLHILLILYELQMLASYFNLSYNCISVIIIIIISLSQSTAGHRPLQLLAISLDLRLLASSFYQPSCANRHSTWPEGVLRYVYLDAVSTPELVYPSGYRFYG